jgi:hypothetical protein
VRESRVWGYSGAFDGVARKWDYGTWMLEDGNRINFEYSGTSQPTGNGGRFGTYDGIARIAGGTGPFSGIRGMLVDVVEFNTDSGSEYNRATSKGEYWFID